MELEDVFKELSRNQRTLAVSVLIHFPLVYVLEFYLYLDFREMEIFPQVMFTSAYSLLCSLFESLIEVFFKKFYPQKDYNLFLIVYLGIVTFAAGSLLFAFNMLTLFNLLLFYILTVFGGLVIACRYIFKMKKIINQAWSQRNAEIENEQTENDDHLPR